MGKTMASLCTGNIFSCHPQDKLFGTPKLLSGRRFLSRQEPSWLCGDTPGESVSMSDVWCMIFDLWCSFLMSQELKLWKKWCEPLATFSQKNWYLFAEISSLFWLMGSRCDFDGKQKLIRRLLKEGWALLLHEYKINFRWVGPSLMQVTSIRLAIGPSEMVRC